MHARCGARGATTQRQRHQRQQGNGAAHPIRHVALVADEDAVDGLVRVLVDGLHPSAHVVEGVAVHDVIHEQDTLCAAKVALRDGPEALLPRCVPDLQLDLLSIDVDRLDLEVNADRSNERWRERVVCISQQQARLSDTCSEAVRKWNRRK